MHGSWGNLISAEDAFEQMGADVMRWQYCQQPPTQNLRFGYKAAGEIKRRLLTLWNSVRFLTDYGSIEGFAPAYADVVDGPPSDARAAAAGRVAARARPAARARRRDGVRRVPHRRRRAGRRDVRRGPLELVHPPLAAALLRVRRGGVPDAVDGAGPARPGVRADHAVPRRAPVADARRVAVLRCAGVGAPRGLAGGAGAVRRRRAARGDRVDAARRPARPPRADRGGA